MPSRSGAVENGQQREKNKNTGLHGARQRNSRATKSEEVNKENESKPASSGLYGKQGREFAYVRLTALNNG